MNNFLIQKISNNKNKSKDKKDSNQIINTVSSIKETNFQTTENVTESNSPKDILNEITNTLITTESSNNNINNLFSKLNFEQSKNSKKINSIIFLDWDDTLFCTYIAVKYGHELDINKYPKNILIEISILEIYVINLLEKAIKKGDTYIITNSLKGWIEHCCKKFFPNVLPLLKKVTIVYSKNNYMKKHPKCALMWKRECFNEITNKYNLNLPSNIISIGDRIGDLEAGRDLGNKFKESFIKTIKFKIEPTIEELIYELSIVYEKFDYLCETCQNWNIFCEKIIKNQN